MIDDLLLQLPILIKLKVQVPMSLFSIKTAPVPLDAETYIGEKREYTQIIPETELIALTKNNYIPLTQAQISLCAKMGYMYYCEYAHSLKKCTEHTCMSAIYYIIIIYYYYYIIIIIIYYILLYIILYIYYYYYILYYIYIMTKVAISKLNNVKQCKTIVTFDTTPESKIEYSTYCILNRSELCECSLTAGNYLLSYTNINCGNVPEATDGYFTTYYAFNKIVLDIITEKFDIQVVRTQELKPLYSTTIFQDMIYPL